MEKAFDRVPQSLIWWSMRKLGIDEWLVRAVQAMYRNAVTLQAITEEFKTGYPWELLYADDLALIAKSLSELEEKKGVGRNSIRCTQCKLWTH
uniref:Reverse transcriptase domain-containing protein n=1 Tax=Octopus bimaculoides TaxID=37653 RepID=A0A0L8FPW1_OCTBM